MMRAFDYVSAATKAEAVHLLGTRWEDTEVLAGGADLLALMKDDVVAPKRLVNIKGIKELKGVASDTEGLRIGALTTLDELADNKGLQTDYPALAEALLEVASPQIRNMATLGGNLCQRPRCWYFRSGFGLLPKDESGKDLVSEGENRYHAILGNDGPAKFVSPSTIAPVLIAYGAKIRIEGPDSKREIPLENFYRIPKTDIEREHDLRPNEIVTEILIPSPQDVRAAHYEIRQKEAFDWPLAVAAAALKMSGSRALSARIVMGHVAPVPWRSAEAEQAVAGNAISENTASRAGDAGVKNATPLSQNTHKVQLARVAVKRAILKAVYGGAA
jgi:xanthine dehydrogenase YagS FAD-binding subunit